MGLQPARGSGECLPRPAEQTKDRQPTSPQGGDPAGLADGQPAVAATGGRPGSRAWHFSADLLCERRPLRRSPRSSRTARVAIWTPRRGARHRRFWDDLATEHLYRGVNLVLIDRKPTRRWSRTQRGAGDLQKLADDNPGVTRIPAPPGE